MTAPAVLGLDLAAESTGVALPDGSTLTIRPPRARGKKRTLLDDLDRIDHVGTAVAHLLATHHPALVVIEDYAPGIRSAAAHRLAEIGGVVRWACHSPMRIPVALVNVMHLKLYAAGSTKAEKRDMAIAAYKRAGAEFPNSDECDAWWLRAMGLRWLDHPIDGQMPKAHLAALYKTEWPQIGVRT